MANLTEIQMLQNQIKELQRELAESEAVESLIEKVRELKKENEQLKKQREDEDYIADCSRCDYRFYEHNNDGPTTDGREFITLICDCGPICKTCLTEKERGQLEEWDEEDWTTELLCQDVEGFRCCVCESVMVTVTKIYN